MFMKYLMNQHSINTSMEPKNLCYGYMRLIALLQREISRNEQEDYSTIYEQEKGQDTFPTLSKTQISSPHCLCQRHTLSLSPYASSLSGLNLMAL